MISRGVEISIAGGGGEMVCGEANRPIMSSYILFYR